MASILLKKVGSDKVKVIKIVRELSGIGMKEVKEAVDFVSNGGTLRIDEIALEKLDATIEKFTEIGAYAFVDKGNDAVEESKIIILKAKKPEDSVCKMDSEEKERLLREAKEEAEKHRFKPVASIESIPQLDRETTMHVLLQAQKIAEEFEECNSNIVALKKKIFEERGIAMEIPKKISSKTKWIMRIVTVVGAIVGLCVGVLIGAIIGAIIAWVVVNLTLKKSDLKKHEVENKAKYNAYVEQNIDPLVYKLDKMYEIRDTIIGDGRLEWAINAVGEDMFYSKVINELYILVKTRRADTIKEAVNKFDEQKFRELMIGKQEAIQNAVEATAIESAKQSAQLKQIEKNTHQAARAAKMSAAYNMGTYVNTRKKK